MQKKFIIRKIMFLLTYVHIISAMNNNILFNQVLFRYFSEYFENDLVGQKSLILTLNIRNSTKNKRVYLKEKFFLDYFQSCCKIMLSSKLMYNHYSNNIIKKYAKDFLVKAFVTRHAHSAFKDEENENIYFNYEKINTTIMHTTWENILLQNQLLRAQVQQRFYALLESHNSYTWYELNIEEINHMITIKQYLQKNILLEMVQTKSFLLNNDLKNALKNSLDRFEPKDFSAFLENNNVSLILTNPETNELIDCKEILENAKFKKKIQSLLNHVPGDHKFFFVHKAENPEEKS